MWKPQVEVGAGDGRGLRGTHGNPNAPQTHLQIILGSSGVSHLWLKLNMLAESGHERCCVTQEVCGSRETLLRMREGTASSQTEQPWTDRAVPGKTSKDKGQVESPGQQQSPRTVFSPGLNSRLWPNL